MAISNFTDKQIIEISKKCKTKNELAKALGYANGGGTTNEIINRKLQELGVDFVSTSNSNRRYTDEELFCKNTVTSHAVRRRYKKLYPPKECAICHIGLEWQGKPLELRLDHINGDHFDNNLTNLRWICPNCDSQLDTYCGRNRKDIKSKNYCIDCGKEIGSSSVRCPGCSNKIISKTNKERRERIITRQELKDLIRTIPFTQIGTKYNVSDNAIRKWCVQYNLPRTKKEINSYSDEEWLKI